MEINTKEIFEHMDLQRIITFILEEGWEINEIDNRTYDERLKESNSLTLDRMKKLYENDKELTEARNEFYHALSVNSKVFTEIGMKAGARLLMQLLYKDD
jgi:hypothetical protein